MRERFLSGGGRGMATYELLEMLLYYVIPYRDTKPTATELLERFGGLDGVLRASAESLAEVSGVGRVCADFLRSVGRITQVNDLFGLDTARRIDTYPSAGRFLCNYFKRHTDARSVVVYLDSCMRVLHLSPLTGGDFGSASVKPREIIRAAVEYRASAAVIGFIPTRPRYLPDEAERATAEMLRQELDKISVSVVEQFMIQGDAYLGITTGVRRTDEGPGFGVREYWDAVSSAISGNGGRSDSESEVFLPDSRDRGADGDCISLLRIAGISGADIERMLPDAVGMYGSLRRWLACEAGCGLSIGDRSATILLSRLLKNVLSRRYTDLLALGRRHSDRAIADCLVAYYQSITEETPAVLCYDELDRLIAIELLDAGCIGEVTVSPRRVLEAGMLHGARSVAVAHNHPGGIARMSDTDERFTRGLYLGLLTTGMRFRAHYLVAHDAVLRSECGEEGSPTEIVRLR